MNWLPSSIGPQWTRDNFQTNFLSYDCQNYVPDVSLFREASLVMYFVLRRCGILSILTHEETLDVFKSGYLTSPGLPFTDVYHSKQHLVEAKPEVMKTYWDNKCTSLILWKYFPKEELRTKQKLEEKSVRSVCVPSFPLIYAQCRFFFNLLSWIVNHVNDTPIKIGFCEYFGNWHRFVQKLKMPCIFMDAHGWDKSVSPFYTDLVYFVLAQLMSLEGDDLIRLRNVANQCVNSTCLSPFGYYYNVIGSRKTGEFLTALGNSMVHCILIYAFMLKSGYSRAECLNYDFAIVGDDSVLPQLHPTNLKKFLGECGFRFDLTGIADRPEDVEFLGRRGARYQQWVVPIPINRDRLIDSLCWTTAANDELESVAISKCASLRIYAYFSDFNLIDKFWVELEQKLIYEASKKLYLAYNFTKHDFLALYMGAESIQNPNLLKLIKQVNF